jgi:hypothetical protein
MTENIVKNGELEEDKFEAYRKKPVVVEAYQTDVELEIETLEGTMRADVGDYIIKGVSGEAYPCKPNIFYKTYEKVENNNFNKNENENRFQVYKIDDMYGVNDNLKGYGIAWDKSKIIINNLCELLNNLNEENMVLHKRLEVYKSDGFDTIMQLEQALNNNKKCSERIDELNEEKEYWKHKVMQLLFILQQFDKEKVKKLIEDLE